MIFNFTTSLVFVPFLGLFTKLIKWLIPEQKQEFPLQILNVSLSSQEKTYDSDIATVALKALEDDKKYMTRQALEYISSIW